MLSNYYVNPDYRLDGVCQLHNPDLHFKLRDILPERRQFLEESCRRFIISDLHRYYATLESECVDTCIRDDLQTFPGMVTTLMKRIFPILFEEMNRPGPELEALYDQECYNILETIRDPRDVSTMLEEQTTLHIRNQDSRCMRRITEATGQVPSWQNPCLHPFLTVVQVIIMGMGTIPVSSQWQGNVVRVVLRPHTPSPVVLAQQQMNRNVMITNLSGVTATTAVPEITSGHSALPALVPLADLRTRLGPRTCQSVPPCGLQGNVVGGLAPVTLQQFAGATLHGTALPTGSTAISGAGQTTTQDLVAMAHRNSRHQALLAIEKRKRLGLDGKAVAGPPGTVQVVYTDSTDDIANAEAGIGSPGVESQETEGRSETSQGQATQDTVMSPGTLQAERDQGLFEGVAVLTPPRAKTRIPSAQAPDVQDQTDPTQLPVAGGTDPVTDVQQSQTEVQPPVTKKRQPKKKNSGKQPAKGPAVDLKVAATAVQRDSQPPVPPTKVVKAKAPKQTKGSKKSAQATAKVPQPPSTEAEVTVQPEAITMVTVTAASTVPQVGMVTPLLSVAGSVIPLSIATMTLASPGVTGEQPMDQTQNTQDSLQASTAGEEWEDRQFSTQDTGARTPLMLESSQEAETAGTPRQAQIGAESVTCAVTLSPTRAKRVQPRTVQMAATGTMPVTKQELMQAMKIRNDGKTPLWMTAKLFGTPVSQQARSQVIGAGILGMLPAGPINVPKLTTDRDEIPEAAQEEVVESSDVQDELSDPPQLVIDEADQEEDPDAYLAQQVLADLEAMSPSGQEGSISPDPDLVIPSLSPSPKVSPAIIMTSRRVVSASVEKLRREQSATQSQAKAVTTDDEKDGRHQKRPRSLSSAPKRPSSKNRKVTESSQSESDAATPGTGSGVSSDEGPSVRVMVAAPTKKKLTTKGLPPAAQSAARLTARMHTGRRKDLERLAQEKRSMSAAALREGNRVERERKREKKRASMSQVKYKRGEKSDSSDPPEIASILAMCVLDTRYWPACPKNRDYPKEDPHFLALTAGKYITGVDIKSREMTFDVDIDDSQRDVWENPKTHVTWSDRLDLWSDKEKQKEMSTQAKSVLDYMAHLRRENWEDEERGITALSEPQFLFWLNLLKKKGNILPENTYKRLMVVAGQAWMVFSQMGAQGHGAMVKKVNACMSDDGVVSMLQYDSVYPVENHEDIPNKPRMEWETVQDVQNVANSLLQQNVAVLSGADGQWMKMRWDRQTLTSQPLPVYDRTVVLRRGYPLCPFTLTYIAYYGRVWSSLLHIYTMQYAAFGRATSMWSNLRALLKTTLIYVATVKVISMSFLGRILEYIGKSGTLEIQMELHDSWFWGTLRRSEWMPNVVDEEGQRVTPCVMAWINAYYALATQNPHAALCILATSEVGMSFGDTEGYHGHFHPDDINKAISVVRKLLVEEPSMSHDIAIPLFQAAGLPLGDSQFWEVADAIPILNFIETRFQSKMRHQAPFKFVRREQEVAMRTKESFDHAFRAAAVWVKQTTQVVSLADLKRKLRDEIKGLAPSDAKDQLQKFLHCLNQGKDYDRIGIFSELDIWHAIVTWISFEPGVRQGYIPSLISCLRLGLLEKSSLDGLILPHIYIRNCEAAKAMLENSSAWIANQGVIHGFLNIETLFTHRIPQSVLLAIGGWSNGGPTKVIESFDMHTQRWTELQPQCQLSHSRAYHGCVNLNGLIYVIGGFDGLDYFSSTYEFDPATKIWTERAPMHNKRCYVSVAVLNGYIYAMGGYDGAVRLNTVEKYDPTTNQWSFVQPMIAQRSDSHAAVLNGRIVMCGGFNGDECLSSCEAYDPQTDSWSWICSMSCPHSGLGTAVFNGKLYAIGGFDGHKRLEVVETYDPALNQWQALAPMKSARSNFGIEIFQGDIFVMGGFNGAQTTNSVEGYNIAANSWFKVRARKTISRSALHAVVLSNLEYPLQDFCDPQRSNLHVLRSLLAVSHTKEEPIIVQHDK